MRRSAADERYLLQWRALRAFEDPDAIDPVEERLAERRIARNLVSEAGRVQRLRALEPGAWADLTGVVRATLEGARLGADLDSLTDRALDRILPALLRTTPPATAQDGQEDGPDSGSDAERYVFVAALYDWAAFIALRSVDEPPTAKVLERARSLLPRLLHRVVELPQLRRLSLVLAIFRQDQPDFVVDHLQRVAEDVVPDASARAELLPVPDPRLNRDDEIAEWLGAELGRPIQASSVATSRSVARRTLVDDDPAFAPLLDLLLPYRKSQAGGGGEAPGDPIDREVVDYLSHLAAVRSFALFPAPALKDCRRFANDIPALERSVAEVSGEAELTPAVIQHRDSCPRCSGAGERLRKALPVLDRPGKGRELGEPGEEQLPPEVERACLRTTDRLETGALRQQLLDALEAQPRLGDPGAEARRRLAEDAEVERPLDRDPVLHDAEVLVLELRATRGAGLVLVAGPDGIGGRLEDVEGELRLTVYGLTGSFEGRRPGIVLAPADGGEEEDLLLDASAPVRRGVLATALRGVDGTPGSLVGKRLKLVGPESSDGESEYADTLRDESDGQLRRGWLTEALTSSRKELRLRRRLGDEAGEAEALRRIGKVHYARGDNAAAEESFRIAVVIARSSAARPDGPDGSGPARRTEAAALRDLAAVAERRGDHDRARQRLERARRLAEASGDHELVGWIVLRQGRLDRLRGQFDDAVRAFRDAAGEFEAADAVDGQAAARAHVGEVHLARGHLDDADDCFAGAAMLGGGADVAYWRGRLAHSRGRGEDALQEFRTALDDARRGGIRVMEGEAIMWIGRVYQSFDALDDAHEAFDQALKIFEEIEDRDRRGMVLGNLSLTHLALASRYHASPRREGELQDARKYAERALEERVDALGRGIALNTLARVLAALGHRAQARETYAQARAERSEDARGKGYTLSDLGQLDIEAKDFDQAIEHLDKAIEDLRGARAHKGLILAFARRAQAHAALGGREKALRDHERAAAEAEALRQALYDPRRRQSVFANVNERIARHALLLHYAERPLDALKVVEAGRARVLRERLAARAGERGDGSGRAKGKGLQALDPAEHATLTAALERLLEPEASGGRAALLEYVLGEEESLLIVGRPGDVQTFALPPRRDIESRAVELWLAVAHGLPFGLRRYPHGHWLYRHLVAPAHDLAGPDLDLVVVPDGALNLLPFSLLLSEPPDEADDPTPTAVWHPGGDVEPEDGRKAVQTLADLLGSSPAFDWASLPYLLRRGSVASVPSLEVAAGLLPRAPAAATSSLVVHVGEQVEAPGGGPGREEVATLSDLLPGSESIATRKKFVDALGRHYRFVHVAGESRVEPGSRGTPTLPLAGGRPCRPADLLETRLFADLAALSCDESARGRFVGGEGVMGFPYALMAAGTRNSIAALGPVPDSSTPAFMRSLYERLLAGDVSFAQALRETQLEVLGSGAAHPLNWGTFALFGPGR